MIDDQINEIERHLSSDPLDFQAVLRWIYLLDRVGDIDKAPFYGRMSHPENHPNALPSCIWQLLNYSNDTNITRNCVFTLAKISSPIAITPILSFLKMGMSVKWPLDALVEICKNNGISGFSDELIEIFQETDSLNHFMKLNDLRAIVKAIGDIGNQDSQTYQFLLKAMGHFDKFVSTYSLKAMKDLGYTEWKGIAVDLFFDKTESLNERNEYRWNELRIAALDLIKEDEDRSLLRKMYSATEPHSFERYHIARAQREIGHFEH